MADDGGENGTVGDKKDFSTEGKDVSETNSKESSKKKKVDVLLKATGDAPIMKKKKWAVDPEKTVAYLLEFIRRYIKMNATESLISAFGFGYCVAYCFPKDNFLKFIYVNQTFVPSPDELISNLYECFGSDNKLVLHYCKTQAWG